MEAPKEIYLTPYWMPGEYDDDWHLTQKTDEDVKYIRSDLAELAWIDCRKQMPPETKQETDDLQGHHEWMASELVLAWDSMYGPRVDYTKNK